MLLVKHLNDDDDIINLLEIRQIYSAHMTKLESKAFLVNHLTKEHKGHDRLKKSHVKCSYALKCVYCCNLNG